MSTCKGGLRQHGKRRTASGLQDDEYLRLDRVRIEDFSSRKDRALKATNCWVWLQTTPAVTAVATVATGRNLFHLLLPRGDAMARLG